MESLTAASPCPNRILVDAGAGFAIGGVGGSIFHFAKGFRNMPSGARFAGGLQAIRMNAPRVAGSFAVWGGVYSACDCALVYVRKKEDPWNPIIAGAAASGILSLRQGFRAVVRSSMHGAIFFALIGGAEILLQSAQPGAMSMPADVPTVTPMETSSGGGRFGGLFAEKVEGVTNSSSKTDTLDN
jgi:import inner membrane translocase subunit TIM17